jgi:hypothetical protein
MPARWPPKQDLFSSSVEPVATRARGRPADLGAARSGHDHQIFQLLRGDRRSSTNRMVISGPRASIAPAGRFTLCRRTISATSRR